MRYTLRSFSGLSIFYPFAQTAADDSRGLQARWRGNSVERYYPEPLRWKGGREAQVSLLSVLYPIKQLIRFHLRRDADGIIMHRLLSGLQLCGTPLISLGTSRELDAPEKHVLRTFSAESASSIDFITTSTPDEGDIKDRWYRSPLYASGGVVLSENQDTILCQVCIRIMQDPA